jgi:hypothetical protein
MSFPEECLAYRLRGVPGGLREKNLYRLPDGLTLSGDAEGQIPTVEASTS